MKGRGGSGGVVEVEIYTFQLVALFQLYIFILRLEYLCMTSLYLSYTCPLLQLQYVLCLEQGVLASVSLRPLLKEVLSAY